MSKTDYYPNKIIDYSTGGQTDVTVPLNGTVAAGYGNYRIQFKATSGSGLSAPNIYVQPQLLASAGQMYNDGTGRVDITMYLVLAKNTSYSSDLYRQYVSCDYVKLGSDSATKEVKQILDTIPIQPGISNHWLSKTESIYPGQSMPRSGSFRLVNYNGSTITTMTTPTITFRSPVSTSDKMSMKFSSGRSDVSLSGTSSFSGYSGLSVQTPTLSKTSVTEKGTTNITISFNSNGGTPCDSVTKTINTQRTVTADNNWAGTGVAIGGTTTITSGTWTASWSAGSWETVSEASVGTLPKPTRTGYKFSGWTWNGGEVTSTTKFSTNATLVAQWTPVEYNIKYDMGTGSSKSGFTPLSIDDIYKTYATNATISTETPTWNDARQLFVNWKGSTSGNTYNVGATIGDTEYFEGATTSRKAILTGQWKDNPNTIYLKYYHPSSSSISTDTLQYGYSNITNQQIWKITNPTWTDRSFVGWIKADLVDDTWKNNYNTTKGVYESIDDLETTISKNLITQYSVSMSNQSLYLPWAHSETYYAIWVKTGKKIKLSSGWRDIQSVYFKGNDNKWHRVTDVWTKTSSGWKHEI